VAVARGLKKDPKRDGSDLATPRSSTNAKGGAMGVPPSLGEKGKEGETLDNGNTCVETGRTLKARKKKN